MACILKAFSFQDKFVLKLEKDCLTGFTRKTFNEETRSVYELN